jgi:hypothetical protein
MMIEKMTVERLTALLREAEAAHGNYEKTLGHADDNWPRWYAQYILEQVPEAQWQ